MSFNNRNSGVDGKSKKQLSRMAIGSEYENVTECLYKDGSKWHLKRLVGLGFVARLKVKRYAHIFYS